MSQIKDAAGAIALAQTLAQSFATRAHAADKAGKLPAADVAALQESGYLGLSVPKAYGGYGLTLLECVLAQLELAQGSASSALVAGMQIHIFGHEREIRAWDEAHYDEFSQAAAAGALFNALASEPDLGSPSRGGLPATTALRSDDGQGLVVNGRKTWSTGGRFLTHLLVRADLGGEAGVVLIEQDNPGIRWLETWSDSLSLRASDSHDVVFANAHIPHTNLVQNGQSRVAPNVWFPLIMSTIYLGAALAARNCVIQFALERVPTALGKPIATLPKIQRQIGEMDVSLKAARALLLEVAGSWAGDEADRPAMAARIAAAKTMVTETANSVTDQALRIAGGSSITRALPLERYFRDVRAGSMQPPSGDTALEIIGRAAISEFDAS